jgi:hypothetical protein
MGPHQQVYSASDSNCHNDGIFFQAVNGGTSKLSNVSVYNNIATSDMCSNSSAPGNNCTAWVFFTGSFNNVNIFNNVLAAVQGDTQGFESFIRFGTGYLDNVTPNGNATNVNILNNTTLAYNVMAGVSCDCAGIKTTTTQSSSNTGFVAKNNIWSQFPSGGYSIYLNESGTFDSVYGVSANIDNNVDYSIGKFGTDFANGQGYGTLTLWQTPAASPNNFQGYDGTVSTASPLLNSSYFPQTGSSAINLGANLTSLGITALDADLSGATNCRPSSGNWGAGALCFGSEPTVATPMAAPGGGIYGSSQSVTLSTSTSGATICWRVNATPAATTPGTCDAGSTTYSGAITVSSSETLNFIGTLATYQNSSVGSASYTIGAVPVPAPTPQSLLGVDFPYNPNLDPPHNLRVVSVN